MTVYSLSKARSRGRIAAFSLVEVVLALGVIGFAIIAMLGVIPVALSTGRDAQNETRAAQIAQDIVTSISSQSQASFPNVTIAQPSSQFSYNVDLSSAKTYNTLGADNDGNLVALATAGDASKYPFQVNLRIDPDPAGFDAGYASKMTVRVAWQPFAQNYRDFVRIVTKY